MRVLLDENKPLALFHRLHRQGVLVEHIILNDQRGLSDEAIIRRLRAEPDLLFLTQDGDFLWVDDLAARVIVSRVRQSRPTDERVEVWVGAIQRVLADATGARLFELFDDGTLVPYEEIPLRP